MNAILKKLRISPPHRFLCVNAPSDFSDTVCGGTSDCSFTEDMGSTFDSIHWFVRSKQELESGYEKIRSILYPGLPVWVYYPKGSSGVKTDLNRDSGWDMVEKNQEFRWLYLISFNETWSAFCFRLKTDKDLAEDARPKEERLIFKYADSATKTITLPDDLKDCLDKHPEEKVLFEALSFSHRREYVEWIITAKQAQTRQTRLEGTLEKLRNGFKNPAGR